MLGVRQDGLVELLGVPVVVARNAAQVDRDVIGTWYDDEGRRATTR